MENDNRKCRKCHYFDRYYTKGIKRFNGTQIGRCRKKGEQVGGNDACEQFSVKHNYASRSRCLRVSVNDLLTELTAIRKALEAEEDEKL